MRNWSTPRAHSRPSQIAQTTSDWPRRMSPQAKTPGTLRHVARVDRDVAALVELDAEVGEQRAAAPDRGSRAPAARGRHRARTRCPAISRICGRPLSPFTHSRRTPCSFLHVARARRRRSVLVLMLQSRMTPSSCERRGAQDHRPVRPRRDVRACARRAAAAAARTGAPRAAPWRFEVPRQSEPVSPPPRMTTRLPVGADLARRRVSPATTLFCCGRNSIAKWMPFELAAGHRQIARPGRAAGEHDRRRTRRAAARPVRRRRR